MEFRRAGISIFVTRKLELEVGKIEVTNEKCISMIIFGRRRN